MEIHTITPGKNGLSEYGEYFIEFIQDGIKEGRFFNEDKFCVFGWESILETCKKIEANFKGIYRQTGEYREYYSHLYEVAKLYLKFAGNRASLEGLIIALRHDDIEDLNKDAKKNTIVEFKDIMSENNLNCAVGVEALSKPKIPHIDQSRKKIKSSKNLDIQLLRQEERDRRDDNYYQHFKDIESLEKYIINILERKVGQKLDQYEINLLARDIAIIRIVDRIHNLNTMPDEYDNNKRLRKLQGTEKYLLPLAKALNNPELYSALLNSVLNGYKTYFKIEKRAKSGFSI